MSTTPASETSAKASRKESRKETHNGTRNGGSHNGHGVATADGQGYVLPMVHVSLPESAVNVGFWSVLVGSVVLGAVDLPLAALIGAGVLIAKHRRSG